MGTHSVSIARVPVPQVSSGSLEQPWMSAIGNIVQKILPRIGAFNPAVEECGRAHREMTNQLSSSIPSPKLVVRYDPSAIPSAASDNRPSISLMLRKRTRVPAAIVD